MKSEVRPTEHVIPKDVATNIPRAHQVGDPGSWAWARTLQASLATYLRMARVSARVTALHYAEREEPGYMSHVTVTVDVDVDGVRLPVEFARGGTLGAKVHPRDYWEVTVNGSIVGGEEKPSPRVPELTWLVIESQGW